jgi:hypothetical protein
MTYEPLPGLDAFCLAGLEAGRALGKPHRIEDSDADLVWAAAEEVRDAVNYLEGRVNQKGVGELERAHLLAAMGMLRNVWKVMDRAREYQRRGGV